MSPLQKRIAEVLTWLWVTGLLAVVLGYVFGSCDWMHATLALSMLMEFWAGVSLKKQRNAETIKLLKELQAWRSTSLSIPAIKAMAQGANDFEAFMKVGNVSAALMTADVSKTVMRQELERVGDALLELTQKVAKGDAELPARNGYQEEIDQWTKSKREG